MPNADTTDRGGEEREREALSYLDSSTIIYTGDQIDFLTYRDTLTDHDLIQVITHAMTQYANAEVRNFGDKLIDDCNNAIRRWGQIPPNSTHYSDYIEGIVDSLKANIEHIQSLLKSIK